MRRASSQTKIPNKEWPRSVNQIAVDGRQTPRLWETIVTTKLGLRRISLAAITLAVAACAQPPGRAVADPLADRTAVLETHAAQANGVLGACIVDRNGAACANGDRPISMQSVMKLLVGMAVLDAVDQGRMTLEDEVLLTRDDVSVFVQPLEKLIGPDGHRTTVGELIRGAITESDSLATDWLIDRLGGTAAVQAYLDRKGIVGVRLDRDERRLQTEIFGLTWRSEFTDPDRLDAAIDAVPPERREAAFRAYQNDVRDTATPRGLATLLYRLGDGQLLSAGSTRWILDVMGETGTFPDRLRAGTPADWWIGHKTGSSSSWAGVVGVTNDVGVMRAPDGAVIGVVALLANSSAPAPDRAAAIAGVSRIAADTHRP